MPRLDRRWTADTEGRALATELHLLLEVSHRQAKGLLDAGCVKVNGEEQRKHGHRLHAGDSVEVAFEESRSYQPIPRGPRKGDAPFEILLEDRDLVFVDKPAGLLTVPAEKGNEASLADGLKDLYRRRGMRHAELYVVHRLDRWTSGVLVFAKTPEALHGLKSLFEEHRLQRVYKAILAGELPENSGTLTGRIVENPKSLRMRVVQPRPGDARPKGAKEAVTHYRVMERLPGHTVVEVKLETGRRNQIRVQFADRGYPLLGDQVYGQASELLDRQALHAELLGFRHPVTGEPVSVSAPFPPDMESALKALRLRHRLVRAEAGRTGEADTFHPLPDKDRQEDRVRRAKRFTKREGPPSGRKEDREGAPPRGPRRPSRGGEERPRRPQGPGGKARPGGRPAGGPGGPPEGGKKSPRKFGPGGKSSARPGGPPRKEGPRPTSGKGTGKPPARGPAKPRGAKPFGAKKKSGR
ncbi:MAG: RNA-binding S4 domain-containing protein [Acidobacteria bacterium]|nr:RNA-binding S4 domain-containing protein [Acidobacteriota bacterium]